MYVGKRIVNLLSEYGVDYVFGVPGGQTLALYQGIMESEGRVKHVLMRDERSAGFAADGWARMTGRTGVCDATVGPGVANLIAPVAEAYSSSIPLIAFMSDIPRAWEHKRVRGNASQGMRQLEIFQTISKWQAYVSDPESIEDIVDTAFRIANTGRPGPVVLSIPDDVFTSQLSRPQAEAEFERSGAYPRYRSAPDPASVERAVQLVRGAKRPALLVGGGALISGAYEQVRRFSEQVGAPVATTISGKGIIPEDHPLAIGVAGSMGNPVANDILLESDLMIFVGTKGGQVATLGWDLPKDGVPLIHIDIDPEEIGRVVARSVGLVGDAKLSLDALLSALDGEQTSAWDASALKQRVRQWYDFETNKEEAAGEPLRPQRVMGAVNRFARPTDVAVCDASLASGWGASYFQVATAGRHFIAPRGLAGLGWGAPAAIGAALAGDAPRILMFAGDGGYSYSMQELEVMVRLNLPIVTVIFNNDTLGWIKHVEQRRFKERYISTDFNNIDFAKVAQGFGARGYRVNTMEELEDALRQEENPDGPAVIDVQTDQWESPVLRFSSTGSDEL